MRRCGASTAQGFRGVRFNFSKHLGARHADRGRDRDDAAARATSDWHLQVHFDSALIGELAPHLARSAVPVVIDHMGRVDASLGVDQPAFRTLRDAAAQPNSSGSRSAAATASRSTGPPYADAIPFARPLVAGIRRPHAVGHRLAASQPHHVPDDGVLVDLLARDRADGSAAPQALLVDNPQRLYRFPMTLAGASR